MRQNEANLTVKAVYEKRAFVYAIALNLVYSCLSAQALAFQRLNPSPLQHIDTVALAQLYQQSSDYLWLEQQQLTDRAKQALEFIASSTRHGLNPDDYHQDLLDELDPLHDESEARLFDLILSNGMLKLIHDISSGRLDPAIVDPKWSIPRTTINAVGFLQDALSDKHFNERLLSLLPANDQYRRLEAAAQRYQDYVNAGGWPGIPLVTTVRPGASSGIIPAVRNRLAFESETADSARPINFDVYDDKLVHAVRRFQQRHNLKSDGIIGPATIRAMNVPASARLQQIKVNMERLRWLPDNLGNRYIMVNLANYKLAAIEDDQVKLDMRVIVGKKKRPTPSFTGKITHVVFNPYWHVPNKLARLDLLPKQQANPDYLASHNFRVFTREAGSRIEVDPASIDWQSLSEDYFPYSLRQEPGNRNALGRLKFVIPNPWAIYLHDTPSKSLFNSTQRTFSSGCIRVEDPLALANFSLGINNIRQSMGEILNSQDEYKTRLVQPVTVYAVYSTVWFDGGVLTSSPDSYKRDQKIAKYLTE